MYQVFEARVRREVIETVLVKVRGDSYKESLDLAEAVAEDPTKTNGVAAYLVENREVVGLGDVIEITNSRKFNEDT